MVGGLGWRGRHNQSASRKARSCVGWLVAAGWCVGGCGSGERGFLERHVGVEVDLGGLDVLVAEPERDHGVSMPACSSRIAAVCRSTCGLTVLVAIDGHASAAVVVCSASRRWSASRLSARPVRVGNAGSSGCPARSVSQARRTATVCLVSGVMRCLRPFPRQLTCGPVPRWMSLRFSVVSSDALSPVWMRAAASRDRGGRSRCRGRARRAARRSRVR